MVPAHRFASAFARGARTGVRATFDPLSGKTMSNAAVNLLSRSRITNRNRPTRSPRSMARLRACWATHSPTGCGVTPSTWTRRVATSITNSTSSRRRNTVSTVQKSTASTLVAWARRNCRQLRADRLGAGSTPARCRMVHTLLAPIRYSVGTARRGPSGSPTSGSPAPAAAPTREAPPRHWDGHAGAGWSNDAGPASGATAPGWPAARATSARLGGAVAVRVQPAGLGLPSRPAVGPPGGAAP